MRFIRLLLLTCLAVIFGCTANVDDPDIVVSLVADGRERIFSYSNPVTVQQFLSDAEVELNDLDRVNPQAFAQIADGMTVTVVRVTETTECEEVTFPYEQRMVLNEGLEADEERIGQAGVNGVEQICYRTRTENGVQEDRIETGRTTIAAPQDEVVYVGPSGEVDSIPLDGSLVYMSNGNAWIIQDNSTNKRLLTTTGDLDGFVLSLSPDGRSLLYTRRSTESDVNTTFANELWLIADVSLAEPTPVILVPQNILQAHWIPGLQNTISYSTAEPSEVAPGWRAYNDLWAMRINPQTGEALNIENIVESSSFGLYSWWGTQFSWSPNGNRLAWVRADSLGLVDLETSEFNSLIEYPVFNTRQSWSWRASVSWAEDEDFIATTIHQAIGNYPPQTSPAFSAAVVATDGSFSTPIVENSGIWSYPQFSKAGDSSNLAYLKSRDPFNSINGEYDLVIADRDGSNATLVFPSDSRQPGLEDQQFVWNPDGTHIALIYQGNLWVYDVSIGASYQLTLDGGASDPMWER